MPATIHEPSDKTADPLPPPGAIPYFGGAYRQAYAAEAARRGLPPVPRGVPPAA